MLPIVARCTTFLVSYDSRDFRSNGVDMASHARVIMAVQARSHVQWVCTPHVQGRNEIGVCADTHGMHLELLRGPHFVVAVDSMYAKHGIVRRCVLLSVPMFAHSLTVLLICQWCCLTDDVYAAFADDGGVCGRGMTLTLSGGLRSLYEDNTHV